MASKTNLLRVARWPRQFVGVLAMEGAGMTRMAHIYMRHGTRRLRLLPTRHSPTPAELQEAGEQLKDIPRLIFFCAAVVTPLPGFVGGYTLAAIAMERWLGGSVRLLPNRLRPLLHPDKPDAAADGTRQD